MFHVLRVRNREALHHIDFKTPKRETFVKKKIVFREAPYHIDFFGPFFTSFENASKNVSKMLQRGLQGGVRGASGELWRVIFGPFRRPGRGTSRSWNASRCESRRQAERGTATNQKGDSQRGAATNQKGGSQLLYIKTPDRPPQRLLLV